MLSHLESIKACLSLIQTKAASSASSAWAEALLFAPDSSPGEVSSQCALVQTENLNKKKTKLDQIS